MRTSGKKLSSTPGQRWVLALTSVASFMVGLDILVVTTALTEIRQDLGASISELEWIVNAYTLSFAVLLMTAAALGDRFGRRRLFVAGIISAAPMPWIARPATRALSVGASPMAALESANTTTPTRNARRRPKMSPSRPPVTSSTAKLSV